MDDQQRPDPRQLREERLKHPAEQERSRRKKTKSPTGDSRTNRLLVGLLAASLVLALVLAFFLFDLKSNYAVDRQETQRQLALLGEAVQLLEQELSAGQDEIRTDLEQVQKRLGLTQGEIQRARALAQDIRKEQQKDVRLLTEQILSKADSEKVASLEEKSDTKFDEVDQQIEGVRSDVVRSRKDWEEAYAQTREELDSLGLQLTEQGQLIATNGSGIEELRKRGERDYFEFDGSKNKKITIAGIGLELRKTNQKNHHADLRLFFDDKRIDQKRTNVNSPVTFYVGPDRIQYELVINTVDRNQVAGYVSVPSGALETSPQLNRTER